MNDQTPLCFVVMPFRAELNFFYLYLRRHLQEHHGLQVERGDHRILTVPLLEKIREQILEAKVLIADITGRNANVFYELGLAHAYEKPVILLTQDSTEEFPLTSDTSNSSDMILEEIKKCCPRLTTLSKTFLSNDIVSSIPKRQNS